MHPAGTGGAKLHESQGDMNCCLLSCCVELSRVGSCWVCFVVILCPVRMWRIKVAGSFDFLAYSGFFSRNRL